MEKQRKTHRRRAGSGGWYFQGWGSAMLHSHMPQGRKGRIRGAESTGVGAPGRDVGRAVRGGDGQGTAKLWGQSRGEVSQWSAASRRARNPGNEGRCQRCSMRCMYHIFSFRHVSHYLLFMWKVNLVSNKMNVQTVWCMVSNMCGYLTFKTGFEDLVWTTIILDLLSTKH